MKNAEGLKNTKGRKIKWKLIEYDHTADQPAAPWERRQRGRCYGCATTRHTWWRPPGSAGPAHAWGQAPAPDDEENKVMKRAHEQNKML